MAITILGNLAYWNGRRLRWDPARWEFVDDLEANRWLDRIGSLSSAKPTRA